MAIGPAQAPIAAPARVRPLVHLRRNPSLFIGVALLSFLAAFALLGPVVLEPRDARVGAFMPRQAPSAEHLLGTDTQGRDVLTTLALATPQTLRIGLMAGVIGLAVGVALGLLAGFFPGPIDSGIRLATDVLTTIPNIAILVVVATSVPSMTVELMALILAALAWRLPTRTVRSQTLSLRERAFVQVARLNGMSGLEIVFREVLPNLLPYIAASFVVTVSQVILASIGLEVLGLGPQNTHTLGMMVYWAQFYAAVLRGMWWWWLPPILMIMLIFVGLMFTSAGLDRVVNARLRSHG
jgi:peptide/nickel transport system permease protein